MMIGVFLLGGLLLAWAFGRNNFGNVFGSAVGTGILSFKWAAFLTGTFLLLGSFFNSSGTSQTVSLFAHFSSLSEVFCFSIIIALMMMLLTKHGIPASIAQISIGGLVGWSIALGKSIQWDKLIEIIFAWFYSPIISCILAFLVFKSVRFFLKQHAVPILYRDLWVRFFWVIIGSFTAYSLGANNLPALTIPFIPFIPSGSFLSIAFSFAAGIGCLMASKKVIRTVSSKLFPLSSVESLIVFFSAALTLLLFSFQHGFFSALPVSISAALIGAIVGISLGKGGYGLKGRVLTFIVASWFWAPFFSGLLCFGFMAIIKAGGF